MADALTRLFLVYGAIIVIAIGLIFFLRSRKGEKKAQQQRDHRERMKATRKKAQEANNQPSVLPNAVSVGELPPLLDDEVDALALLQQARTESSPTEDLDDLFASSELNDELLPLETVEQPIDEEEDIDLADLLAGLGEEKQTYHAVNTNKVHRVKLNTGGDIQAKEVLSIMQDKHGTLLVLMGDTAYLGFSDNPDERKKFKAIMKALASVITGGEAQKSTTKPPAKSPQPTTIVPDDDEDVELDQVSAVIKAARDLQEGEVPLPGDLPDFSLDAQPDTHEKGSFGRIKRVFKPQGIQSVNIADAIEAYLQYKIADTPQFQRRGIHVRSDLKGGVRIEADGNNYESVGDVDNDEVREFLKATIAEWQDRNNRR